LLGITDILIISTPRDTPILKSAIGDGSKLGLKISYKVQNSPDGLPQAFTLGEEFIGNDPVCLMLGDNILHLADLFNNFKSCRMLTDGAYIVGTPVVDPKNFGVIELDDDKNIISVVEKPSNPKSNLAAIGLYFYDNSVVAKTKQLKPSARGELEITDLNNLYLREGKLKCQRLSRGATWLDAGMFDTLADASTFIRIVENRLGLKIGCIEEAAYMMNRISRDALLEIAKEFGKSPYGTYLQMVATLEAKKHDTYETRTDTAAAL
ncbi:MAG TPA: sugar phosphate nucleotidyltransferase, partial [Gammaproteobacteria bacterium]|nr:sugar phosphate nucleotidyltransferase [Gammaproteobacteria bacterium]